MPFRLFGPAARSLPEGFSYLGGAQGLTIIITPSTAFVIGFPHFSAKMSFEENSVTNCLFHG